MSRRSLLRFVLASLFAGPTWGAESPRAEIVIRNGWVLRRDDLR